jgi:murein DD-endopeptidase MepM/ murein hydrolase activator NlpD
MDHLTLIVMADERSPVRRYRLRRRWVTRGPWIVAAWVLLFLALAADWVSLRLDALDVERLRGEAARQGEALGALDAQVGSLAQDLERLRELERKLRVIANLPSAVVEARLPVDGAPTGPPGGQGGAPEEGEEGADAPSPAPVGSGLPDRSAAVSAPLFDEARVSRTAGLAAALVAAASVRERGFEELLAGLQGLSERLAATPSIWPTEGWVTSGFGTRISPFTGRRQFHAGLDIAGDFGTPIVAPAKGRVAFVGRQGGLGQYLVIEHGHGLRTRFAHVSEIFVRRGERVERGARIAAMGSTGRSTGPHLHYGVEVQGKPVNPRDYIVD